MAPTNKVQTFESLVWFSKNEKQYKTYKSYMMLDRYLVLYATLKIAEEMYKEKSLMSGRVIQKIADRGLCLALIFSLIRLSTTKTTRLGL